MPTLNRIYMADSGLIATSGTSPVPALYIAPTALNDLVISRIKVAVEATANQAASPSTPNSILFQLSKVTGTKGGGAAVTPTQISGVGLAANTVFSSGSTALTGLAQSTELWPQPLGLTAGAWAEDTYENTGLEIPLGPSTQTCFYFTTASGPGAGLAARIVVWFAE